MLRISHRTLVALASTSDTAKTALESLTSESDVVYAWPSFRLFSKSVPAGVSVVSGSTGAVLCAVRL